MHGQNIHLIVVRQGTHLGYLPAQLIIIDDVIAADQSGDVEGLARRIGGQHMFPRVGAHVLQRCVRMSFERKIRPDLVADHVHMMRFKHLHHCFQLAALPDSS